MRFALVGAGRLGASLALALQEAGAVLTGFVCTTDAGRHRAETVLNARPAASLGDLVAARPTHYILAVPDGALPGVAAELAAALPARPTSPTRPPVVLHTSGATSVAVLTACGERGALTLAFHPLQTFSDPVTGSKRFAGSAVAVTPPPGSPGLQSVEEGFAIARGLGAHPFLLPDDRRAVYHAAATMASNYLVTLERCAEDLFVLAGMPRAKALSLFLPLAQAALDNVRTQGGVAALTGPLSRGDETTVSAHLQALEAFAPHLLPLYRQMGMQTLDLVSARGQVHPEVITRLAHLLGH